jgi:hypothetical protein
MKKILFVFIITNFLSGCFSNLENDTYEKKSFDSIQYLELEDNTLIKIIESYIIENISDSLGVVTLSIVNSDFNEHFKISYEIHETYLNLDNRSKCDNGTIYYPPIFYTIIENRIVLIYSKERFLYKSKKRYENTINLIESYIIKEVNISSASKEIAIPPNYHFDNWEVFIKENTIRVFNYGYAPLPNYTVHYESIPNYQNIDITERILNN